MASVNFDFGEFSQAMEGMIGELSNPEIFLRPVAVELAGLMHNRIHNEGKASDGSQIGTYKNSYLKIRERYHHPAGDTQVILVLTRKLSNSWGVAPTEKGGYGVGFVDEEGSPSSLLKVQYAEQHFGKKILDLTEDEQKYTNDRMIQITQEIIDKYGGA